MLSKKRSAIKSAILVSLSLTRLGGRYELPTEVQARLEASEVIEVPATAAVDKGGALATSVIEIVVFVVAALANANIERQATYH